MLGESAPYSLNVAYRARCGGGGAAVEQGFFPYFPLLKPDYILWPGASYSPKNMVVYLFSLLRGHGQ